MCSCAPPTHLTKMKSRWLWKVTTRLPLKAGSCKRVCVCVCVCECMIKCECVWI